MGDGGSLAARERALIDDVRRQIDECEPTPPLPDRIGSYRVVGVLGQGGMGVVYRAVQEPTNRPVALKVVRRELLSASSRRRFAHEVEYLSRLRHPYIARIYDAGVAETERGALPFFAMELVAGQSLTNYADAAGLGLRRRLELLVDVCEAVEYAHQRGIVHRDLKPANILVDGAGRVCILDFGVARATDADLQASTQLTATGALLGTLPYMSPEQVAGDPGQLDTRSDVYALGVVAYELLTGQLPYCVAGKPLPEAARIIREAEPPRPSAGNRRLRGDLDTIVTKALAKEPERRYASAGILAADVRRHLRGEPIEAMPPSTVYRLRKFVQRNRVLTAVAVVGALGLTAATMGTGVGLLRADKARRRAELEARTAQRVSAFLVDLFRVPDPGAGGGRDVKAAEILDRGAQTVANELRQEPLVQATLLGTIGKTYLSLGLYAEAQRCATESLERYRRELGERDARTLCAESQLAAVLISAGEHAEAERLLRATVAALDETLGPDHEDSVDARQSLAVLLRKTGRVEEAERVYRETLDLLRRIRGDGAQLPLGMSNNFVSLLIERGRIGEADAVSRAVCAALGDPGAGSHEATLALQARHNRAAVLRALGERAAAETLLRQTLEQFERLYGADHPGALETLGNLAVVLDAQRKYGEAEAVYRRLLGTQERLHGVVHPSTLRTRINLAICLSKSGATAEAERVLREVIVQIERTLPGHWWSGYARGVLGWILLDAERFDDAGVELLAAYESLAPVLGETHDNTQRVVRHLRELYERQGNAEQAAHWAAKLDPPASSSQPSAGPDR